MTKKKPTLVLLPKNPTPEEVQRFVDTLREQRLHGPLHTAEPILPEKP